MSGDSNVRVTVNRLDSSVNEDVREIQTMVLRKSEHGLAQVLVLAAAIPLVVAGTVLLTVSTSHLSESDQLIHKSEARTLSVSGAHDALARLAKDAAFEGEYELAINGGVTWVTVSAWGSDGLDNNGDTDVDDAAESEFIGVTSAGWLNAPLFEGDNSPVRRFSGRTEAIVEVEDGELGIHQSMYIDDPMCTVSFSGNAFLIDGSDHALDGSTNGDLYAGISIPGDPDNIIDQLSATQQDNVVGLNGWPSVTQDNTVDFDTILAQLSGIATTHWVGDQSFTGTLGTKIPWAPEYVLCDGDLKIHGNTSAAGVIVVKGDLECSGSFDFDGVIVVTGSVRFMGGGGKTISGALVTLGAVDGTDISVGGNVTIRYGGEAIGNVSDKLDKTNLVTFMQK